jgi:hypothetical protein
LSGFDINPDFVNVEDTAGFTSCAMNIQETGVGVEEILDAACVFVSPSGTKKASCLSHSPWQGDRENGDWTCSVPFAKNSEDGDWVIDRIDIRDTAFNTARFSAADLAGNEDPPGTPAPFPTFVGITSVGEDTTPPSISGFTANPPSQDVTIAPGSVLCAVTCTDDTAVGDTSCVWEAPTDGTRISCTAHAQVDDEWTCDVPIAQGSEVGTWDLTRIECRDGVRNTTILSNAQVAALPGTTTFDIVAAGGTGGFGGFGGTGGVGGTGGTGGDACGSKTPDLSATAGWSNSAQQTAATQTLTFTGYVRSTSAAATSMVTIGNDTMSAYGDAAMAVRFDLDGFIDVRDGGGYACDNCTVPWVIFTWYKVTIVANVTNSTYTVSVGECDGPQVTVITDAAFRSGAPTAGGMDYYGLNHVSDTVGIEGVTWNIGACVPKTCAEQSFNCDTASDTCGGTATPDPCGTCGGLDVCQNNVCCTPSTTVCTDPDPDYECGDYSDGCGGTVNCDTGGQTCSQRVAGEVCDGAGQCVAPGEYPTKATTGVADAYWCPRWSTLKSSQAGGFTVAANTVEEYREVTDGKITMGGNNAFLRCSKVTNDGNKLDVDSSANYGTVIENVRMESAALGSSLSSHLNTGYAGMTWRRVGAWPTSKDVWIGMRGGFIIDSYLDTKDQLWTGGGDPHSDVLQPSGGCGPHWIVHNHLVGEGAREYNDTCGNTPAGFCSNSVNFQKGGWGTVPCRNIQSLVVANNLLDGGLIPSRWNNNCSSGSSPYPCPKRIMNSGYWDNEWVESWRTSGGPCSHEWDNSPEYSVVANPDRTHSGNEVCVEADGNFIEVGASMSQTSFEASCDFGPTNEPLARGGCTQLLPIPIVSIPDASLSAVSCTQGQAACDNIDITVTGPVTTNEGARGQATSPTDPVGDLWWEASPGGSFRWRYSCGGSPSNTEAAPCTTQAGRCNVYQVGDEGADLWYDYPDCNGATSCTMTDVCDFSDEGSTGTHTVKVYVEAGPGAAFRPSSHREITFTIN